MDGESLLTKIKYSTLITELYKYFKLDELNRILDDCEKKAINVFKCELPLQFEAYRHEQEWINFHKGNPFNPHKHSSNIEESSK